MPLIPKNPTPSQSIPMPPWTLRDLGWFFCVEFFLIIGFIGVSGFLFNENGLLSNLPEGTITGVLYLIQTLIFLGPLYFFTREKYGSTWNDFGLRKIETGKLWKNVGLGFLIYYIVSSMIVQIKVSTHFEIPGYGQQESHVPLFGETIGGLVFGGLMIVIFAPLVEELLFRGYLYQIFKKYTGIIWGSILSAFIFSLFHMEFQVVVPIFILGLVLNGIYERSGSLWTPLAFHMINNALAFGLEIAIYNEWIVIPTL